MALTVREAMALGGLKRGEVLAGASGLDRTITWVKVLESPETISWLAEGELLLTVAFAIKDDEAAQKDLMRNLAAVGSAGLVIKPERYLPHIPDDMLGQADEFKIPLIRIPPDVSYLEIMNPILERIINAQNTQLRRSIEIHTQFTHLALDGQGLDAIGMTFESAGQTARFHVPKTDHSIFSSGSQQGADGIQGQRADRPLGPGKFVAETPVGHLPHPNDAIVVSGGQ